MQQRILKNLLAVSLCGILLATVALFLIQTIMAHNRTAETFAIRLENVAYRIRQNELQIEELSETLREDYLARARFLAMLIDLDPDMVRDPDRLNEVAAVLNVDEIHIVDERGILGWGTQPGYCGMDLRASEQARPFLAILEDPALELVQDPMPNGFDGLMRQYVGVSLRGRRGIALIGLDPVRLEHVLRNNRLAPILRSVPVGDTGYAFSVSSETGRITAHPDERLIGLEFPLPSKDGGFLRMGGQNMMYGLRRIGDQTVIAVVPTAELYAQRTSYTLIFMGFMVCVFSVFCAVVNHYVKRNIITGIVDTVATLDKISAGNLNVNAGVRTNPEFIQLSDGINQMIQNIRAKMQEIAAMSDDVKRFGAIVAIADAGFIVKDRNGVVRDWNIGAENILGYLPGEIVGKTTKYYAPEDQHGDIDRIEERLSRGEHIAHVEVVRKRKDGQLIDCSASYTPIFDDDGRFSGSVAIFHDISDKKRIEKALQDAVLAAEEASRAKSSFLANMSHEIRTPMNGVIGFAELALDDPGAPDSVRDCLQKIKLSADGLLAIINDILDLSKIEAGKTEIERTPFSLHEVFKQCETISGVRAAEKGIALYFCAESPVNLRLLGDPTRLRQVLLNLLSNAIKFTNRGTVKLVSRAEPMDDGRIRVYFEVKDSGIGMSPEQLERVFAPFTQADSSTTREFGGTGLGLAITKSLIELMGGHLTAESRKGMGSSFSFSLPFETHDETRRDGGFGEKPAEELPKPLIAGDVLVCEDNAINQQVILGHLRKTGVTVTIVENGKLGVEAVRARNAAKAPFDLIFMDIHMPVMDGLEAAQKLIELGNRTPVVALTANAMGTEREAYLDYGMSDCLFKPFRAQDLWKCLMKYLPAGDGGAPRQTPEDAAPHPETAREERPPVIDRGLGAERCGDEELYAALLSRFAEDGPSALEEIREAIAGGDTPRAARLVHTLKSVSGTLGAAALYQASTVLSRALERGEPLPLRQAEAAMEAVLAALRPLPQTRADGPADAADWDRARAAALAHTLSSLLENYDSQCLDLLPEIRMLLSPAGEDCGLLTAQIEACDFEAARKTLKQIQRALLTP